MGTTLCRPARDTDGWISSAARRVARVRTAFSMLVGGVTVLTNAKASTKPAARAPASSSQPVARAASRWRAPAETPTGAVGPLLS